MRKVVMNQRRSHRGAPATGALYRETLQTTGCYVDRVVIVSREFTPIPKPPLSNREQFNSDGHQNAFFKAWRNLSFRCGPAFLPKPGPEHRLPPMAPDPSPRTRREERALLIVPMSSDRLFLDRVARQHGPSPLHRHVQNKSIAQLKETDYHRTVNSVLTVCLTSGGKPSAASPLVATSGPDTLYPRNRGVETSLDTARTCACATLPPFV